MVADGLVGGHLIDIPTPGQSRGGRGIAVASQPSDPKGPGTLMPVHLSTFHLPSGARCLREDCIGDITLEDARSVLEQAGPGGPFYGLPVLGLTEQMTSISAEARGLFGGGERRPECGLGGGGGDQTRHPGHHQLPDALQQDLEVAPVRPRG